MRRRPEGRVYSPMITAAEPVWRTSSKNRTHICGWSRWDKPISTKAGPKMRSTVVRSMNRAGSLSVCVQLADSYSRLASWIGDRFANEFFDHPWYVAFAKEQEVQVGGDRRFL